MILTRRMALLGAGALLTGCDRLASHDSVRKALFSAENFHRWAQRSLMARDASALTRFRRYSAPMAPPIPIRPPIRRCGATALPIGGWR